MKLISNIFKYVLILLAIAFMVTLSAFAVMMIGKVSIFGYTYVKYEKLYEIYDVPAETTIQNINIVTSNVAVEISVDSSLEKPRTNMSGYVHGIFKDNIKTVDCEEIIEGNTLSLRTIEPSGLTFQNDSILRVYLPATLTGANINIQCGTNKISFEEEDYITFNNLSIKTSNDIKQLKIPDNISVTNHLSLTSKAGRFYVDSYIHNDLTIDSTFSTFIFSKNIGNESSNVSITGKNPSIEFGSETNPVDVSGNLGITCTDGGLVRIFGDIGGDVSLDSRILEFRANNVTEKITAMHGVASLYINGELGSENNQASTIHSGDGYVYINKSSASLLTVTSTKNDIKINELCGGADFTNDYGSVIVTCSDNMLTGSTINAVTKNGKVDLKNVVCPVSVVSTKGSVYAEFANVTGTNTIETNSSISVKVKDTKTDGSSMQYKFVTSTKSGNVDVQLGGEVEYNNWNGEDVIVADGIKTKTSFVNNASESTTNTLQLKTVSGKITAQILN